jgi:hypothetical protein
MKKALSIISLFFFALLMNACLEREEFSVVPEIKLLGFIPYQNTDSATLLIGFKDGDGDIGVRSNEVNPPYNFFLQYYEKQNGVFVEIEPTIPFYYRLPIINETGKDRPLQGEIEIGISFYYDLTSPYDTIKYTMYLVDRANNKSNVIEVPEMIINKN